MKARQKGKQNSKREMENLFRKLARSMVKDTMDSLVTTSADRENIRMMIEEGKGK